MFRRSRGFTLLELLVVLSIVALATAGAGLAMRDSGQTQLEREAARLPPFVHQALLTAHAPTAEAATGFLATARAQLLGEGGAPVAAPEALAALSVCDPVPMPVAQVRGEARAQLLVESVSRAALHAALVGWLDALRAQRTPVRWQLVVDPLEI